MTVQATKKRILKGVGHGPIRSPEDDPNSKDINKLRPTKPIQVYLPWPVYNDLEKLRPATGLSRQAFLLQIILRYHNIAQRLGHNPLYIEEPEDKVDLIEEIAAVKDLKMREKVFKKGRLKLPRVKLNDGILLDIVEGASGDEINDSENN
jgi:hypothetical protein